MKLSLFAIFPIIVAIAFCAGEWRAGNIYESFNKKKQYVQLPEPTIVDPAIAQTVKAFRGSHENLVNCIQQARQIASLLGDLVVEHKSFGTCQNDHDIKYAPIDFDKSMAAISKFKEYLMDRCPVNE